MGYAPLSIFAKVFKTIDLLTKYCGIRTYGFLIFSLLFDPATIDLSRPSGV